MTGKTSSRSVIKELNTFFHESSHHYPDFRLKMIEDITARKDQLAPSLLEIIDSKIESQSDFTNFCRAARLLAYLQDPNLFPRLIALCRNQPEIASEVFYLNRMLTATAYDRWEQLKPFIRLEEEPDQINLICLEVLPMLWVKEKIPRQELIAYFRSLLREILDAEKGVFEFTGHLVIVCSAIWPEELLEEIRELYGRCLVNQQVIDISDVLRHFKSGIEDARKRQIDLCNCSALLDERPINFSPKFAFHEYMQATEKVRQEANEYCDVVTGVANSADELPGRNCSCSCGSGKKYKRCCGLKMQRSKFLVPQGSRMYSAKITYGCSDNTPREKMTREDFHLISDSNAMLNNPKKTLGDLYKLVERYPDIPQLYNYLHICHRLTGMHAKANLVLAETVARFPKYLFGLVGVAEYHLKCGEPEKVLEIYSGHYDLMSLYPERSEFHVTEVLAFNSTLTSYFVAIGDIPRAKAYYDLMVALSPDSQQVSRGREQLYKAYCRKRLDEVSAQFAVKMDE